MSGTQLFALVALLATATPAAAQERPNPFGQGKVRLSLGLGLGLGGGGAGGGLGVYVLDGLEVGVDGVVWFGDHTIGNVSPEVRYVLHMVPGLHPYAGAFYRRWFLPSAVAWDRNWAGGRAGILYFAGRAFVGLGVLYEVSLDGNTRPRVFPELTISLAL